MDYDRLLSDYFDDELSPAETTALFQWVASAPENARRFARAAFLHRCLEHRLSAMRLLEQTRPAEPQGADPAGEPAPCAVRLGRPRFRAAWRTWCAVAAALLLVAGVLAYYARPRRSPAQLLAVQNVTWGAGTERLKVGDHLPEGRCVLNSGFVQLGFDNGNRLLIQGPARFTVAGDLAVRLDEGSLAATVATPGRGLKITTPAGQVTDLGTEFGVQASPAATRVQVFIGRVVIDRTGAPATELTAGNAVELSAAGLSPLAFDPSSFPRAMPFDPRPLDLIDLLAGGDGRGDAGGFGINAATGQTRETRAVTVRQGNRQYIRAVGSRVLDGCFIPGGRMPVDSAGHTFTFPATSLISYGLIWGGGGAAGGGDGSPVPWGGELPIATTLPQDAGSPASRVLVLHSNNGLTLALDAIRALEPSAEITGFRARVGNSFRAAPGAGPTRPLASIHVIVDGVARFERLAFANVDAPIDVDCPLSDNDHFLTLATTDGGDGNACDWVLWTRPELPVRNRRP